MSQSVLVPVLTNSQLEHIQSIIRNLPSTTLSPGPGSKPTNAKTALQRCCAAWKRAFKAYMDESDDRLEFIAAREAAKAYCNAMPLLVGSEGVRDFIACAAHGILIGAIPPERSGQLLYAAQVALNASLREPKPPQNTAQE